MTSEKMAKDGLDSWVQDDIDLAAEIKIFCRSEDYEANGVNLDAIIVNFLRSKNLNDAAIAFEDVLCWRA